jgi:hypothetical protein
MKALRAMLLSAGETLAPDSTLLRIHLRARIDLLLTLLVAMMALGLSLGYQLLRHLPASWRDSLLGDGPSQP